MENQEKCECGMPLEEKTRCSCESKLCVYCCACSEDCSCNCAEKAKMA